MKKAMILMLSVFLFAAVLLSCSADGGQEIATVNKAYARYELTELATRADLIVKGTVSGKSDPIKIKPTNGGDASLFTDLSVDVESVYRGKANSDTVTVRVQGGELDDFIVESPDDAVIEIGTTYIFFLYQPAWGMYITENNPYEIISGPQSVFTEVAQEKIAKSEQQLTVDHLEGIEAVTADSLSEDRIFCNERIDPQADSGLDDENTIFLADTVFAREMEAFNEAVPIDPEFMKKESAENLKHNLDNGFITQEEYDQEMSRDWDHPQYAEIIE